MMKINKQRSTVLIGVLLSIFATGVSASYLCDFSPAFYTTGWHGQTIHQHYVDDVFGRRFTYWHGA